MLEILLLFSSAALPALAREQQLQGISLPGGIPAQDNLCQQTAISNGKKFVIFH